MLGPASHPSAATSQSEAARLASVAADGELVRRIGNGDRAALAEAAQANFAKVFAIARRILGDDAEAEDVSQEAFVKLWNKPPDLGLRGAQLPTWLYRVTSNLCIDRLRKKRPDQLDDTIEIRSDLPGPEQIAERAQVARAIDETLALLPDRQRAALALTYYEGLSNREAAQALDVTVDALESLLSRARRAVKQRLHEQWRDMLGTLEAGRT